MRVIKSLLIARIFIVHLLSLFVSAYFDIIRAMKGQGKTKNGKAEMRSKRVFVGMSGGVDSSVSAAILKRAGYEVTGVFIKVWQPDWMECNWREDRLDAMRVAATLDIPFFTLDLEKEYKRDVVDYMIAEYKAGRTPNPDVMCNKSVKFGGFYDWAMERGADFVATGHYSRIVGQALLAGSDPNKDQSYFLWNIRTDQLPRILFPIGDIEKPEVRKLARKFKLPNADKKDSQGLCFIGKVDIKEFLSHYMEPKAGNVLDEEGNVIGHHDGVFFLTIGERHGFFIDKKTPHDEPYYIVAKDLENNTITVSNKDKRGRLGQAKTLVRLEKTNWMSGTPVVNKKYSGRARYRQPLEPLVFTSINEKEKTAEIDFDKPQNALTPGQSLVVYEGQVCLGGGIIL